MWTFTYLGIRFVCKVSYCTPYDAVPNNNWLKYFPKVKQQKKKQKYIAHLFIDIFYVLN